MGRERAPDELSAVSSCQSSNALTEATAHPPAYTTYPPASSSSSQPSQRHRNFATSRASSGVTFAQIAVTVSREYPLALGCYSIFFTEPLKSLIWVSVRTQETYSIELNGSGRWELKRGDAVLYIGTTEGISLPTEEESWAVVAEDGTLKAAGLEMAEVDGCGRSDGSNTSASSVTIVDLATFGITSSPAPQPQSLPNWDFIPCISESLDQEEIEYISSEEEAESHSEETHSVELSVSSIGTEGDQGCKNRVHDILEVPTSSAMAFAFSAVSLTVVLGSTIALLLETLPKYQAESRGGSGPWFALETGFVAFFTLELVVRFWATPSRVAFFKEGLNLIDVVAVLPFYIEVAAGGGSSAGGLRVLRVIRVVRVFRILKIARYAEGVRMVMVVMRQVGDVLLLVMFVVCISLVLWSTCVFHMEGAAISSFDEENTTWFRTDTYSLDVFEEHSPFQSIPATFWWCISTITVVGYGDVVPYAGLSKAVASVAMVSATFIIAIPASVFGSTFLSEYQRRSDTKLSEKHSAQKKRSELIVKIIAYILESASQQLLTPAEKGALIGKVMWSDQFADIAVAILKEEGGMPTPTFLTRLRGDTSVLHHSTKFPQVGKMGLSGLPQWGEKIPLPKELEKRRLSRKFSRLGDLNSFSVPGGSGKVGSASSSPFGIDNVELEGDVKEGSTKGSARKPSFQKQRQDNVEEEEGDMVEVETPISVLT